MSDIVEKLLNVDPNTLKQLQEEHEKLKQMTPEELEEQAFDVKKSLGIDQSLLQEIRHAKALQESFGIHTSRKPPDPLPEMAKFVHPEAVSAANSKAMVELLGRTLDIQEKLLEGAEQDRKAAQKELKHQHRVDLLIILLAAATLIATVGPLIYAQFF